MDNIIDPAFERWLIDNRPLVFELLDAERAVYRKEIKAPPDVGTFPWRKPMMKTVINPIKQSDEPSEI